MDNARPSRAVAPQGAHSLGTLEAVPETAYGFRTKAKLFIERIEALRVGLGKEKFHMHILDVGCGNGIQMTFPLGGQGYRVMGVDMHEASLDYAAKNNPFPNVRFQEIESGDLKEAASGEVYDVIILSDILEHLDDPAALLKTLREILAPGGIVLVSIPNGRGPFEIENFIFRKLRILALGDWVRQFFARLRRVLERHPQKNVQIPYNRESGHVQFFTFLGFRALVEKAGFQISFFQKGSFLCGPLTARILALVPPLLELNVKAGRYLPRFCCSVWYFECRAKPSL